jgi:hypothetical protein
MTLPNLRLWPLAHLLLIAWGQENLRDGEEQYPHYSAGRQHAINTRTTAGGFLALGAVRVKCVERGSG